MTSPLHVLLYGTFDAGICDTYRFGMHRAALARHGIEMRALTTFRLGVSGPDAADPTAPGVAAHASEPFDWDAAVESTSAVLDRDQIDWADVIVFRRFYITQWSCNGCVLGSPVRDDMVRHQLLTGHPFSEPDRLVHRLFEVFEQHPELLRGRAIVYETDDDLLNVAAWNGVVRRIAPERETIERMVRRADLVTVTTPILAARYQPFNEAIRVVRNAIDPTWYTGSGSDPTQAGDPRLLYYGSPVRMRDYAVCRPAVDELVRHHAGARRVWLGALDGPLTGGSPDAVIAAVDEVLPYVEGPAAFSQRLAGARPDIGLAPLVGDPFDQAKSELHWLEYTMAGAATVATRIPGGGPYDVIRDGVDGLLVTDTSEWLAALTRLADSPALREDLANRARERVLADYTVDVRAAEWADAYRWAAEHAGRTVAGRVHGLGELGPGALEAEASAAIAHRDRARVEGSLAPGRLAALRGGRAACWPPEDAVDPLVSVVIPVVDEPLDLVLRAIRSVVAGSFAAVEIIVAAAADDLGRLLGLTALDPRVRLVSGPRPDGPDGNPRATRIAGIGTLLDAALSAAAGSWVAPLGPEAEFSPDHVEVLLSVAIDHELEFVYGQAVFAFASGKRITLGSWPPTADGVLTIGTELFSRRLASVARFDAEAWRDGETSGWAFWRSVVEAGSRIASIDVEVTHLRLAGGDGPATDMRHADAEPVAARSGNAGGPGRRLARQRNRALLRQPERHHTAEPRRGIRKSDRALVVANDPASQTKVTSAKRRPEPDRTTGRGVKYLVCSFDYAHASAGPKTLHRFCHELNEAGQEAYVSHPVTNPDWNTPYRPAPLDGNWIVVYPEVVRGNPWNAPHVARWLLNSPGRLGGDTTFDPNEVVFVFAEMFNDLRLPPERLLHLPTVEIDIYNDRGLARSGALFYIGKGRQTRDLPGAVEITPELRADRPKLADALNRAAVLYTFDDATGMTGLARLCGCPVVIIPSNGHHSMAQYALEGTTAGIGWDALPAPFDSAEIRAEQIVLREAFQRQLAEFIRTTQAAARAGRRLPSWVADHHTRRRDRVGQATRYSSPGSP